MPIDIEDIVREIQRRIGRDVAYGDDVGYGVTHDGAIRMWIRPKGEAAWEFVGELDAGR